MLRHHQSREERLRFRRSPSASRWVSFVLLSQTQSVKTNVLDWEWEVDVWDEALVHDCFLSSPDGTSEFRCSFCLQNSDLLNFDWSFFFFICREAETDHEVPNGVSPPALHLHLRDPGSRSVHPIYVDVVVIVVKHVCWWRFIVIIQHHTAAAFLTKPSFPMMGTNGSELLPQCTKCNQPGYASVLWWA